MKRGRAYLELDAEGDTDLDLLDDEELIQLTEESTSGPLDIGAADDDGFFDTSGDDLSGPEIELTDEEIV